MDKLNMHTPNLADENYKKLAALFPNAVMETVNENGEVVRAIDKDVLMQEINTRVVDGREERYQFTWPDKKKSVLAANAPISATLRPIKADSVGKDAAVFEVPATPDPDPTPAPSDDGSAAVIVAATVVGGAAVGVGAYMVGTTVYLKSVLPEGMAIPANRQQLAVALWTAAGKPATQSTALFNDVAADAAELQAIRWAVDTGLMTAQDGSFKPGSRVSRLEVIRTWKNYQKRG